MAVRRLHSLGRTMGTLTLACLGAVGLATIAATPAAATTESTSLPTSWAYVDSTTPRTSYVNQAGDLPIGAFTSADGATHVARAFITFDLSTFQASDVLSATFTDDETAVADCATPRDTQVIRTGAATKPTWNNQPAELSTLPGPAADSDCQGSGLTWDAAQAVRDAVAAKAATVTFELRLPAADETNVDLGRRYRSQATLTVRDNKIPSRPGGMLVNGRACTTTPIALPTNQVFLASFSTDGDNNFFELTYTYDYWPVDHPDQRTEVVDNGGNGGVTLNPATLADGTTYVWQVRASDGTDTGPVSKTCQFAIDLTAPAVAPAVTSTSYPATGQPNTHGGTGIPGTFTIKATGDPDVVGFYYAFGLDGTTFVAANHAGGSAKVQFTPTVARTNDLFVYAADAAGNVSPTTDYQFDVADNSPAVTCTPASAFIGVARQCTFTPRAVTASGALPVVEYDYTDFQSEFSVTPGPDGSATVTVLPVQSISGNYSVAAQAKLSNGQLTEDTQVPFNVDLGFPQVTPDNATIVVGQQLTFTVHAVLPGSVTFTYADTSGGQGTVPVGPDGSATITVTPPHSTSFGEFFVRSTTAASVDSGTQIAQFTVLTNGPTVTSTDYPAFQFGGGIGQPGTFTFTSPVPGAQSFTYTLNGDTPTTVPVDANGTTSVRITPTGFDNVLTVTSILADGSTSEPVRYEFLANSAAPNITCDPGTVILGDTFRCTFTPVQADVVSYTYQWSNETPVTVPADAAGSATITLTAADQDFDNPTLQVSSTDAQGITSGRGAFIMTVNFPPRSTPHTS
jgi:plastocyanin